MQASTIRSTPLAVLGIWVVVGVALSGASAWALTEAGGDTSVATQLIDDDAGHPLFTADTDLVPDHPRSACLKVDAAGGGPDDQVRLLVQNLTGRLAPQLGLDVFVGTGGRYGDCTGFVGDRIFHGTVDGLAGHGDSGIVSGWTPGRSSTRTFKFVVTLSDAAAGQGTRAGATFVWRMATAAPVTTPTGSPTPSPTRSPGPGSGSGPGSVAGASPTGSPSPTGPTSTTSGDGGPTSEPTGAAAAVPFLPSGPGSLNVAPGRTGDLSLVATVPHKVGRTVAGVLGHPQFALYPVLVAVGFLLIQHRIDARDPKLVNASRSRRDLTVAFPTDYGSAGHQGRQG